MKNVDVNTITFYCTLISALYPVLKDIFLLMLKALKHLVNKHKH